MAEREPLWLQALRAFPGRPAMAEAHQRTIWEVAPRRDSAALAAGLMPPAERQRQPDGRQWRPLEDPEHEYALQIAANRAARLEAEWRTKVLMPELRRRDLEMARAMDAEARRKERLAERSRAYYDTTPGSYPGKLPDDFNDSFR